MMERAQVQRDWIHERCDPYDRRLGLIKEQIVAQTAWYTVLLDIFVLFNFIFCLIFYWGRGYKGEGQMCKD